MEENDASKVNNGARLVQIHEAGGNKIQGLGHAKNRISKVLTNIMSRFQHLVSRVSPILWRRKTFVGNHHCMMQIRSQKRLDLGSSRQDL